MCRILLVLAMASLLLLLGCADSAKEKFDTAQFEEIQNNKEHARVLYEEIIRSYPGSEYAKKAQQRLDAIGKPPAQTR